MNYRKTFLTIQQNPKGGNTMIKKYILKKYSKKSMENRHLFRNKKAIKYLDKILFLDKNNIDAIIWKGYCYACMYNKSESMKYLDLASKLLPDSDELLIKKGICYSIMEEYELSIDCFKKVYNPESPDTYLLSEIGSSYLYWDKYSEALFYFNEILKINENDSNAYKSIALVYQYQEDYDTAIKYFDIALDLDCENIIALTCKADSLIAKDCFSESLECLNKILSINNDMVNDILTKIMKSYVLSYLGEFDESLRRFEEIKKLDFDDYGLKKSYYSYYAKSLVNMERLDNALKVYDEFLDNYPFNEEIKKDRDELFDNINK